MSEEQSIYNCGSCKKENCDFNPKNPAAYFDDPVSKKQKIYPGIEIVHEFTLLKGCAVHPEFITPLDLLEKDIKTGRDKYQEIVDKGGNENVYILALKALQVCSQRIEKYRNLVNNEWH